MVLNLHSTIQCNPVICCFLFSLLFFFLYLFSLIIEECVFFSYPFSFFRQRIFAWRILAHLLHWTPESLVTTSQDGWNHPTSCPFIPGINKAVVRVLSWRILARHTSLWATTIISFIRFYYPCALHYNVDHSCPNNNFIEVQSGFSYYSWFKTQQDGIWR